MDNKEFRRELRKNMTDAERILWNVIRNRKLEGRKFRRQYSIDKYTVDFFCFEENLIIEVDGESHNNIGSEQYDFYRDELFVNMGYIILRVKNEEIYYHLEEVLNEIRSLFITSP
jgi:very-short-patch-repair endonuclease